MPHPSNYENDYDDDFAPGRGQPHRGVMILVFGILGLVGALSCVLLGVFGIVAWVMGRRDLELIERGLMDREGEQLTRVGYILGIIGSIIFGLYMLLIIAYFAFIAVMIATH